MKKLSLLIVIAMMLLNISAVFAGDDNLPWSNPDKPAIVVPLGDENMPW